MSPQDPPDFSTAMPVDDLARWYEAAFHGHLAIGRAIAGHVPAIGPLEHKWLAVSSTYLLVTQSAAWLARLEELRVPPYLLDSPAAATTDLAVRLCGLGWREALIEVHGYIEAWRREMLAVETFGDALNFHDHRLLTRAATELAVLSQQFAAHDYVAVVASLDHSHFVPSSEPAPRTATRTPALPFTPVARRAYPEDRSDTASGSSSSEAQPVAASLHAAVQIEFIAIDISAINLAQYETLPLTFFVDMARQAHDEMRHCWLLAHCLARFGYAIGDFAFSTPDRYELMAEQDLVYRLVILSRTGESEAIEHLAAIIPRLEQAGHVELARMWDYVLADEVRHTLAGNKWLRAIVGDDDVAVDEATAAALDTYNRAIVAGRLNKPVRQTNYLESAGAPVETTLRALAGFSPAEIAKMVGARGASAQPPRR